MVKSRDEVIAEFHEEVNMTVEELEQWLEDPKSSKAGTGVGIESCHKIVEILRKNPEKDPEKYDEEDMAHMRKVVSYAKRHLAQEDHLKDTKTREELENTKSTISLKNWGHDPVKTLDGEDPAEGEEPSEENVHPEGQSTESDALNNASTAEEQGSTKEVADDKAPSNKRKLDEDEPKEVDGEPTAQESAPENDAAVNGVSVDKEGNDEGDEEGSEDRPRKKSKVDGKEEENASAS